MPRVAIVSHSITMPDGMGASMDGNTVTLTKDGNSLSREFNHNNVSLRQIDDGIEVFC